MLVSVLQTGVFEYLHPDCVSLSSQAYIVRGRHAGCRHHVSFYQPLIDAPSLCVAANETEEILQLVTQHNIEAHSPSRALSLPRRARSA